MAVEFRDDFGRYGLLGIASFRNLPAIVRHDKPVVAIATDQSQSGDESRDSPFVDDFGFDCVVTVGQMLFDIDFDGRLPTAARGDFLSVDIQRHRVVARGSQSSKLSGPLECLANEIFLVRVVAPDPDGSGTFGKRILDRIRLCFGSNLTGGLRDFGGLSKELSVGGLCGQCWRKETACQQYGNCKKLNDKSSGHQQLLLCRWDESTEFVG